MIANVFQGIEYCIRIVFNCCCINFLRCPCVFVDADAARGCDDRSEINVDDFQRDRLLCCISSLVCCYNYKAVNIVSKTGITSSIFGIFKVGSYGQTYIACELINTEDIAVVGGVRIVRL